MKATEDRKLAVASEWFKGPVLPVVQCISNHMPSKTVKNTLVRLNAHRCSLKWCLSEEIESLLLLTTDYKLKDFDVSKQLVKEHKC